MSLLRIKRDFILYQKLFTVRPITTKNPMIAEIIALPDPGSIYACAVPGRESNETTISSIFFTRTPLYDCLCITPSEFKVNSMHSAETIALPPQGYSDEIRISCVNFWNIITETVLKLLQLTTSSIFTAIKL